MILSHVLAVGIGGFFGAVARYFVSEISKRVFSGKFPLSTVTVNLLGSFLLGFLIGHQINDGMMLLFGTGFLGAFTTFSTLTLETVQLIEKREKITAILYNICTYVGGILLAFIGLIFARFM